MSLVEKNKMLKKKMEKEGYYDIPKEPLPKQQKEFMTGSSFNSLEIDSLTKKAISDIFKYPNMTKVQEETVPIALTGVDLVAQAKTGTGKTMGFLLPAI